MALFQLLYLTILHIVSSSSNDNCRFALNYTISDILSNNEVLNNFLNEFFLWEKKFINTPGIALNPETMTTYDGSNLDCITGQQRTFHDFSAASKEAIHFMYLLHTMNDNQFKNISNEINVLNIKLNAYNNFNERLPGFGGYLPWFTYQKDKNGNDYIIPAHNWQNKTPSLDNGELYWCLYGVKWSILQNYQSIISNNKNLNINNTLNMINKQLNLMEINAKKMFYAGNGKIRSSVYIENTSLSPNDPLQRYTGSAGNGDPFEGELFQWLLVLRSNWNKNNNESDEIWNASLNNLHSVNYTYNNDKNSNINIIVQEGWHFSSHEQWKLLVLPYLDIELLHVLYENGEKVRTLNSDVGKNGHTKSTPIPGMYASINSPAVNCTNYKFTYDSGAGIPSIAYGQQTTWNFNVITPYSTMTLWLFNRSVSAAWLLNMMQGTAMQNIYGITESIFINGTAVCPMVSWANKMLTYNGAKGGIAKWTKYGLQMEGLFDTFINKMTQHYQIVFGDDPSKIRTNQGYGLPEVPVPSTENMHDFTTCT